MTLGASDLHLRTGAAPLMRVDGALAEVSAQILSAGDLQRLVEEAVGHPVADPPPTDDLDFAVDIAGIGRFRGNAYRVRGAWAMVLRHVRDTIPSPEDLHLPSVVTTWADEETGLVLVCGPTGSGKSTTLASLLDLVNQRRRCHILTIEDPVEYLHRDRLASISQREIGTDATSFASALRSGLRQDPDVILIGEIRDAETMRIALHASETGHLVLASLHAGTALDAVRRALNLFPAEEQPIVRSILSEATRGILCQRLVPSSLTGKRELVCEVVTSTPRTREAIADPKKTELLPDIVADGEFYGMRTMLQDAVRMIIRGRLTVEEASRVVTEDADLRVALHRAGYRGDHV